MMKMETTTILNPRICQPNPYLSRYPSPHPTLIVTLSTMSLPSRLRTSSHQNLSPHHQIYRFDNPILTHTPAVTATLRTSSLQNHSPRSRIYWPNLDGPPKSVPNGSIPRRRLFRCSRTNISRRGPEVWRPFPDPFPLIPIPFLSLTLVYLEISSFCFCFSFIALFLFP